MNRQNDFIIIDIETTGFDPLGGDEITEIGAIIVDGTTWEPKDSFSTLVRINGAISPFIEQLTGISNQLLDKVGIELKVALAQLSEFCGDLVCYAHNAAFDKRFIRHYLGFEGIAFVQTEWVDTLSIFRQSFPGRKTYKLESLIKDNNLAAKEDHRALSDAMHTLSLLKLARDGK